MAGRWRVGLLAWVSAAPVAAPQQVTVVWAGWVVDVETGRALADRDIVIRGERIEAVRPAGQAAQRAAWFIGLTGDTVLPGPIDPHTRLIGDVTSADPLAPLGRSAAEDYQDGVRAARATLLAGFTTVRDVGSYRALLDVALRRAIDQDSVIGPRMSVAGACATIPGGGGEVTGDTTVAIPAEMRRGAARGPAKVRERARFLLDRGADFIKVIARPLRRPDRDSRWPLGRPDRVLADPVRHERRRRGEG
jgi:imidazolonepropionase-like amidohydrolase